VLVDLLTDIGAALGGRAGISLSEATRRFYEGTFADLVEKARKALEARSFLAAADLLAQALDQAERERTPEDRVKETRDLLARALEAELDACRLEGPPGARLGPRDRGDPLSPGARVLARAGRDAARPRCRGKNQRMVIRHHELLNVENGKKIGLIFTQVKKVWIFLAKLEGKLGDLASVSS
jgi:hypothetical protein